MRTLGYLFSFRGRINRAKTWFFFPIAWAWMFGAKKIIAMSVNVPSLWDIAEQQGGHASILDLVKYENGILAIVTFFVALIPLIYVGLAVLSKRLHDRNKSATWLLLYWLFPQLLLGGAVTYWIVGGTAFPTFPSMVALLLASGITLLSFIELFCLHGTIGENRFGPDPLK